MYIAIKKIGEYRIGDVVPDRQAELWLEMYAEPHVEKTDKVVTPENKSKKDAKESPKETNSLDVILEDYLARNQGVVKKNIEEDDLGEDQLKKLLKIEESDKRRPLVMNAIRQKIK